MSSRPRILTNVRFYLIAGIAQYIAGLIAYNETSKLLDLYGVDILRPDEVPDAIPNVKSFKHFRPIERIVDYPDLGVVNQLSQGDMTVFKESYKGIIAAYLGVIRRVKPDVILISGSYFLPWCLLQAAQEYGKAAILVHYHGVLKKEVAHWTNALDRTTMLKMERDFDHEDISYIFPSRLSKRTVEREVFGHKITRGIVLPNPISPEFFKSIPRKKGINKIGVVSRWSKIKNIDFVVSMAKRNSHSSKPLEINIISDLHTAKQKKPFSGLMHFQKPRANGKLAEFYSKQGVVISPSFFETYGNVAQEAIASGTPALISQQMGVSETFRKIGLQDWITDFSSPAEVLKKARLVAGLHVPPDVIAALFNECASDKIYGQYAALLSSAK